MRNLAVFAVCGLAISTVEARSFQFCSDENYWYPFTFAKGGQATGLHIDIIAQAMKNLGHQVVFKPLPWQRCLEEAKTGRVDGVATASYKPERAEFLNYPDDAASAKKSKWAVSQVEYIVVTPSASGYQYGGDAKTLPTPVRIPRGYSVADEIKKLGVTVDDGAGGDEQNFAKLARDGKGSVVTLPEIAEKQLQKPAYAGKMAVSETPYTTKSYYLPFSKAAAVAPDDMQKVWAEIAKVRASKSAEFAAKY